VNAVRRKPQTIRVETCCLGTGGSGLCPAPPCGCRSLFLSGTPASISSTPQQAHPEQDPFVEPYNPFIDSGRLSLHRRGDGDGPPPLRAERPTDRRFPRWYAALAPLIRDASSPDKELAQGVAIYSLGGSRRDTGGRLGFSSTPAAVRPVTAHRSAAHIRCARQRAPKFAASPYRASAVALQRSLSPRLGRRGRQGRRSQRPT
jgi:hypothetical protein